MPVIPEVLNRESILFKKLRAHGFPLLKAPTSGFAGMTTYYEIINYEEHDHMSGTVLHCSLIKKRGTAIATSIAPWATIRVFTPATVIR